MLSEVKENPDSQMSDSNKILDEPKHHSSKEIATSKMKLEIEVQTKENKTKTALNSVAEIKDCTKSQTINEELTQNVVKNKLPYSCASCTKRFKTNQKLKVHERTHTGEKPYSCKYCNETFSQQGNMKEHEKKHTGDNPYYRSKKKNLYACAECKKTFSLPKYLKVHVEVTHSSAGSKNNGGKSIDMKVRTENDSSSEKPLIKENENSDGKALDETKYYCKGKKITTSEMKLKMEVQTKENKTKTALNSVVEIKVCSKKPLIKVNKNSDRKISDSLKNIKTQRKGLYCGYCRKTFKSHGGLKNHERFHPGEKPEKPYSCKTCNYRSTQKSSVKKHELIHAKEEPKIATTNQQNDDDKMTHSCEYCGKKFTSNALIAHVRIYHTDKIFSRL